MQRHYLWKMDGRTWIESAARHTDPHSRALEVAIERGYATPIPFKLLDDLVRKMESA